MAKLSSSDIEKKREADAAIKQGAILTVPFQNPFVVFYEWTDEADEKAYANL